jgi:hypothetical protein
MLLTAGSKLKPRMPATRLAIAIALVSGSL